ncbi:MAG: SMI1/KNR4 family protein [Lachnospiraceae bacterium]|nr:SMI1/KNR4 family protein [Lachnospiraceae bacterium]
MLKKDLLTIAMNSFGDWFCIELKDGSIWFAYHDKNKNVKIADSFMEFLDNSKSKPIGHIRSIEERNNASGITFIKSRRR